MFSIIRRDTHFTDPLMRGVNYAAYDVSPHRKTFVLVRPVGQVQHPIIVFGWLDALRERMTQSVKP